MKINLFNQMIGLIVDIVYIVFYTVINQMT